MQDLINTIIDFPVDGLSPYPDGDGKMNPRSKLDGISELAESIKLVGLQEPIRVVLDSPKTGYIEDGERRWAACKKLDMNTVPVLVVGVYDSINEQDGHHAMLISHTRSNLKPVDLATALQKQIEFGKNVLWVAKAYCMTTQAVQDHLDLLDAPPEVQKRVNAGQMSMSAFRVLKNKPETVQVAASELDNPTVKNVKRAVQSDKHAGRIDDMLDTFAVELAVYGHIQTLKNELSAGWVNFTAAEQAEIVVRLRRLADTFDMRGEENAPSK